MTSGYSDQDHRFMTRALRLASLGMYTTDPNPRVGCVVVNNGEIVGEGWHKRAGGAHAEVEALQMAGQYAKGAIAYVTLEPCCYHGKTPPCTAALIEAGITKVMSAMDDPNPKVSRKGMAILTSHGIEVRCGLLESEAQKLNRGFYSRMVCGKPYIFTKLAASLDGRTGTASGESQWITGEYARTDVHRLRARSGAIVTGIGTVIADNPSMNARFDDPAVEISQPIRVVVDSKLRMPEKAKMLSIPGRTLIATSAAAEGEKVKRFEASGCELIKLPSAANGRVSLTALIEYLSQIGINEVMVEAGGTLNGALLDEGLIDEMIVYMGPCILGNNGRGMFGLPGMERLEDKILLDLVETRQIGKDLRLRLQVKLK